MPKKKLTKAEIAAKANLNVLSEYKNCYVDILYKHQKAISANKYELGLAAHYKHKIHFKRIHQCIRNNLKFLRHTNNH